MPIVSYEQFLTIINGFYGDTKEECNSTDMQIGLMRGQEYVLSIYRSCCAPDLACQCNGVDVYPDEVLEAICLFAYDYVRIEFSKDTPSTYRSAENIAYLHLKNNFGLIVD